MPLDTLSSDIARLSASVEFWKAVRLIVTIPTLLLTAATIAAQWMELRRSRDLATLQRELLRAKDEQLVRELAEKDLRIADANRAASEASVEAARATKAAGEAHEQAGRAQERAAQLENETEHLRERNLDMQASLTPRVLIWSHLAAGRLRRFASTLWELHVPANDGEASDLGSHLAQALAAATWKRESTALVAGARFPDGVVISVKESATYLPAAEELVSYLLANRVQATLQSDNDARDDRVVVKVGPKPRSALLTPVLHETERALLVDRQTGLSDSMERRRREWRFPPYDK